MFKISKQPKMFKIFKKNTLSVILMAGVLILSPSFLVSYAIKAQEKLAQETAALTMQQWMDLTNQLISFQANTLLPFSNPNEPAPKVIRTFETIITGYSSTPDQTDSSPFITAANTKVREGIIAANFLAFGTKVRMPELFSSRIFVVEDRMHPRKHYIIDVWFPTRDQAVHFGAPTTLVEVLES